jgi:cytochrome c oxidase cbb3-type subunit 3
MADTHADTAPTDEPVLLAHDADGIHEYDNPMPFWWSAIFWGSIGFSALYVLYYMIGIGPGSAREYDADLTGFYQEQAERLGDLRPDAQTMSSLMADQRMMQAAAGMFAANCATCHQKDGGGGTGPNLTDDTWINVKKAEDIYAVISNGVVAKGMPSWSRNFGEAQRTLLASYVAHLRGTKPAAPKAPQGDAIPAWNLPAPKAVKPPAAT